MTSYNNFEDSLIDAVKNYKVIYTCDENNYKNNTAKENAWREIATLLNKTPQECKSKWRHIRDSYRKVRKKVQTGLAAPKSKYTEERLSFIDESSDCKVSMSSGLDNITLDESQRDTVMNLESIVKDIDCDDQVMPELHNKAMRRAKNSMSPYTSRNKLIEEMKTSRKQRDDMLKIMVEAKRSRIESETPTHVFFKAMADIVCTFPPDKIANIRMDICNMVSEMELQNIAEKSETVFLSNGSYTVFSPGTSSYDNSCSVTAHSPNDDIAIETSSNVTLEQEIIKQEDL